MPKRTNYPFLNLKEAIDRTTDLRRKLGGGPYKLGAILTALNYKGPSGASTRAIASLSHYGLLEKKAEGYAVSELTIRIVKPINDEDKELAIQEAAAKPKLFQELLNTYNGEQLPTMLENYLIHNFEMTDQAAKKASNVFKKTIKFAKYIDEEGRLSSLSVRQAKNASSAPGSTSATELSQSQKKQPDQIRLNTSQTSTGSIHYGAKKLPSGITIAFPNSLDLALMLGEFAESVAALETKAQEILKRESSEDEKP